MILDPDEAQLAAGENQLRVRGPAADSGVTSGKLNTGSSLFDVQAQTNTRSGSWGIVQNQPTATFSESVEILQRQLGDYFRSRLQLSTEANQVGLE